MLIWGGGGSGGFGYFLCDIKVGVLLWVEWRFCCGLSSGFVVGGVEYIS